MTVSGRTHTHLTGVGGLAVSIIYSVMLLVVSPGSAISLAASFFIIFEFESVFGSSENDKNSVSFNSLYIFTQSIVLQASLHHYYDF